jgi:hypothetical protein
MTAPYPVELYDGCPCRTCCVETGESWKMHLSPQCGSKRCPGADEHNRHPA